jgi:putative phosphoribosyl transferase
MTYFADRTDAGTALALSLSMFATEQDVIVLGLARGGVPIARRVADTLGTPFGVLVARKIGVPGIEEVALGAIAEGIDTIVTDSVAWYIGVPNQIVERLANNERPELERRARLYRDNGPLPDLRGRMVILVDDGLATGSTLRAAARVIRAQRPRRLVAAVPVASALGLKELRAEVDELITVVVPENFQTVSAMYEDFATVTDEDVLALLGRPVDKPSSTIPRDTSDRITLAARYADGERIVRERRVEIPIRDGVIVGDLGVPRRVRDPKRATYFDDVRGLAILVHGGGSSRDSYRNRYIAGRLRLNGYATLRLDLLTRDEQQRDVVDASLRFDVDRMSSRLAAACEWVLSKGIAGAFRTILVGSSTGAAVALATAAERPWRIVAVVARGGRVDLATELLPRITMPVMLIVGEEDEETLQNNRRAMRSLPRSARLVRIAGASHTFEEPGALGAVAEHAAKWLDRVSQPARRAANRFSTPGRSGMSSIT